MSVEVRRRIDPTMRVLSLGGGTQSCALALMSARGDLAKLDHVVFADTHGELPETYGYLWWLAGVLAEAGIPLHVVSSGSLEAALLSTERTGTNPTPPSHVINPDGSKGRVNQYRCSYDYKRRRIEQKVRQLCGGRGAWKSANVEQWIGFSLEETHRMKQAEGCRCGHPRVSRGKGTAEMVHTEAAGCSRCDCAAFDPWQVNRWPLIELGMKRADTIAWFAEHGYPTPPRSACWFCPNSGNDRWRALKADHPDLWDRAVHLDESIRNGGGFTGRDGMKFAGQMFLHGSRVALRVADLRTDAQRRREDHGEDTLFDPDALASDCDAGTCFT